MNERGSQAWRPARVAVLGALLALPGCVTPRTTEPLATLSAERQFAHVAALNMGPTGIEARAEGIAGVLLLRADDDAFAARLALLASALQRGAPLALSVRGGVLRSVTPGAASPAPRALAPPPEPGSASTLEEGVISLDATSEGAHVVLSRSARGDYRVSIDRADFVDTFVALGLAQRDRCFRHFQEANGAELLLVPMGAAQP